MSVRHLSVLLFVAAAALGRAFALQCSTLPEPTYLTATPSAEPLVEKWPACSSAPMRSEPPSSIRSAQAARRWSRS